jgi:hypothetical protein
MPYEIVKSTAGGKKGYRVRKEGTNTYFSSTALPLQTAKKQRSAIAISEYGNKPIRMQYGGIVPNMLGFPPIQGKPKDYGDTQPAILEVGELIIPVPHVPKVASFLKKKGIKLPGM